MSYARVPVSEMDADDADETTTTVTPSTSSSSSSSSSSMLSSVSETRTSSSAASSTLVNAASNTPIASRIWSAVSSLAAPELPPHSQARVFADTLRSQYGSSSSSSSSSTSSSSSSSLSFQLPPFEPTSYIEALKKGARTQAPILIYLHSDVHGDTADFLKAGLCTRQVCACLEHLGIVVWGGSVHTSDGYEASSKLGVSGFPFLGLYSGVSSSSSNSSNSATQARPKYAQIWVHEGLLTATQLVSELQRVGGAARAHLDALHAEAIARDDERNLRVDQERDYERAMQADLEAANAQRLAEIEEAKREQERAAAQSRLEEEEELEAAIQLSKEMDAEGLLEVCRKRLGANPEPAKVMGSSPGTTTLATTTSTTATPTTVPAQLTTLRLQLPQGKKIERRFYASDTLSLVRDFVVVASAEIASGEPLLRFNLSTNMPPRTFRIHSGTMESNAELRLTLKEAKLVPQAMLFVIAVTAEEAAAEEAVAASSTTASR